MCDMDRLLATDLADLAALRRHLHAHPEVSGREVRTAARIAQALAATGAGRVVTGLGGHGVAGVFAGARPGPTVLLRCELDALPIEQTGTPLWRSATPGTGHLCGHDGHMAIVMGVARMLSRVPPASGRVVLLFQPAEETGTGAVAVCADPAFAALAPDWAFALHNLPGLARGEAHVPDGLASMASVGLRLAFAGVEAHAAAPEDGRSPGGALAHLMTALPALSGGTFPDEDFRLVTLTHVRLGEPAFGIAPGRGEVFVTCRATSDDALEALVEEAVALAWAAAGDLTLDAEKCDGFLAGINDPRAAGILRDAATRVGLHATRGRPLRASEDFGRFGHDCPAALLFLGAGPGPALHNPDYDFDDGLIAPGAELLLAAARTVTGGTDP